MTPEIIVPEPDVLPLPAPLGLFQFLLHLTFFLHLVAMNLLLGGTIIAVVEWIRGRDGTPPARLARRLGRMLPIAIPLTVTLGVAPLLFLQVIYGHLFYTSSVIMAWPWFLVVPLLIVLYYLAYVIAARSRSGGGRANWILVDILAGGLLVIALIYVNNMTLALRPAAWAHIYLNDGAHGMHGNFYDPTIWPRYLHMVIGAMAVAGLFVAAWGARLRDREPDDGRYMLGVGGIWFIAATGAELGAGTWWLMALPESVMMQFMGGSGGATATLFGSVFTGLAAMIVMVLATGSTRPGRLVTTAAALIVITLVGMILSRDTVRSGMLAETFDPASLAVRSQTPVFVLFAVLLVIGLVVVGWMVRVLARASAVER